METKGVMSYRLIRDRVDVFRDLIQCDNPLSAPFITAGGAGTIESQITVGVKTPVPVLPVNEDFILSYGGDLGGFHAGIYAVSFINTHFLTVMSLPPCPGTQNVAMSQTPSTL